MKKTILISFVLLCTCSVSAQDMMRISFLDPTPVVINGKKLQKGDKFKYSEAVIEWQSEDQVMKVVDEETRRQYVLSAKALPENRKGKISDYFNVSRQISTRNVDYVADVKKGGYHFIGYTDDDGNHTVVPTKGMSLKDMPEEIWLCFLDPEKGTNRLETKDFRSLVVNIKEADVSVRKMMSETDITSDDYHVLLLQSLPKEFKDIPLSKQEIEIYVSLKY